MRRVICTDEDRSLWLQERHKYITGSDAAILMGMAKYPAKLTDEEKLQNLARIKKQLTWQEADAEFDINRLMRYGQVYEAWEAYLFAQLTGAEVRHTHALIDNDSAPGLAATLDGMVSFDEDPTFPDIPIKDYNWSESLSKGLSQLTWGDLATQSTEALEEAVAPLRGVGLLEVKTCGEWVFKGSRKSPGWMQQLPEYYWCQVQLQLLVSELPWAIIACTGNRDRIAYVVEPDEAFQWALTEAAATFWGL